MKGMIYGAGVGPGDPELLSLKAVRLIQENDVIALPGKDPRNTLAYKIAAAAVPEIATKTLVPVCMPMIRDRDQISKEHEKGARLLEKYMDQGRNIVFLTLGDPCIYSTFSYLQHILEADGYKVELVPGIPSFCAAAARLNLPLAEWDEPLHIIPAVHKTREPLHYEGNYVLMKSASHMKEVKELLRARDLQVSCVENCSMETERIYKGLEEIPDDAGYFSLIIAKRGQTPLRIC